MKKPVPSTGEAAQYEAVFGEVSEIVEAARRSAVRSVNAVMTAAYWLIGKHVVELEQKGRSRAEYGQDTVGRLAADLSARYGRGFSVRNIRLMRAFYRSWPIVQTASAELGDEQNWQTASAESVLDARRSRFPLPWSTSWQSICTPSTAVEWGRTSARCRDVRSSQRACSLWCKGTPA